MVGNLSLIRLSSRPRNRSLRASRAHIECSADLRPGKPFTLENISSRGTRRRPASEKC